MCGIFGCVTAIGNQPSLSDAQAQALRDLMIHRGPDDAGLWRSNNVLLTLRRLAVIDPTHAGHQPMVSSGTGSALVYNGELYNDAELRRELQSLGCTFKTRCDTETVLQALDFWGSEALGRLRGMYALAFYDHTQHTLLLARDALGVKPLYYTIANADTPHAELIFASEPAAILGHPLVTVEPDFAVVSAYLTTIRTTLGDRTLFKSVHTLQPGESIEVDLSGRELNLTHRYESIGQPVGVTKDQTRNVISESIRAHLRRDVPICCLLSGGLDSSIIAATVADIMPGELQTYCAGADDGEAGSDLKFSQLAASHIGSRHIRVPIDRELFASRMTEMITRQGVPLSTPNEVAINEVARKMRSSGRVVTLSGEGADELFAGYELPMQLAAQHVASGNDDPGIFQLLSNAWLAPELKPRVLQPIAWQAADEDALLFKVYREQFERVRSERDDDALSAHLRFHRRINLTGLLARLDTATMLESIEGRTPFADRDVAAFAESLPMPAKYGNEPGQTKIALRQAFADALPESIVTRPKASFPLPFREWLEDLSPAVRESRFIAEVFTKEAIEAVATSPALNWSAAWPMINLAIWSNRWWPNGLAAGAKPVSQPTSQIEPKSAATEAVRD